MTTTREFLAARSSLAADVQADWRAMLGRVRIPVVRAAMESDPVYYTAFETGWLACARRFSLPSFHGLNDGCEKRH
jgi:hypothetical protein